LNNSSSPIVSFSKVSLVFEREFDKDDSCLIKYDLYKYIPPEARIETIIKNIEIIENKLFGSLATLLVDIFFFGIKDV